MGMCGAELTDDQEGTYAIGDCGKGIPLGHALFSMQELARPIHAVHQQSSPVVISIQSELCATRPLELVVSQHFRPDLLIERVSPVN